MKHLTLAVMLLALTTRAHAADPTLDTGNTAWMICAAMFVLMMCIPGLALFYGGMVRAKNFLSVFTQLFAVAGVIGILWVLFGYSLVVDTTGMVEGQLTINSFIGGLDKARTAVHINSGVAALAAALMLGKRKGYPQVAMPPHNLGFTLVGAGLLWVGWAILGAIKLTIGLRASREEEEQGLDLAEHNERAYNL